MELTNDKIEILDEKTIKEFGLESEIQTTDYSDISKMAENIDQETESLVKERKIPDRSIIGEVTTTELAIDLAMASLAKQTAVKLQRLEKFLGKIEDQLFKDDTLENLNKGDLLLLYTNTRMMRSDAFRMIREIRRDVDFSTLEANLLSMHAKHSVEESEGDETINGILESLLSDDNFLEVATGLQEQAMNIEQEDYEDISELKN